MALPKEPRQKMINMMYLVLTALLALNVSNEILNAFKTVDNSLVNSNGVIDNKNNTIFKSFEEKLKKQETAEKAAMWKPKADAAKKLADDLVKYIDGLKLELKKEAGLEMVKDETGKTVEKFKEDDLDAATRLFLEKKRGEEFLNKLKKFKTDLLAIDPEAKALYEKQLPLNFDPPKNAQNAAAKNDWSYAYFHMTPTVAALTMLSKFQNDIKNSEAQLVDYFHSKIGQVELVYDAFQAFAGTNATYLLPGDELQITAGVGAFSKAALPTVTIDGANVPLNADGVAEWKTTVNSVGQSTKKVKVSFKKPDGTIAEVEKEVKYTVGTPSGVAISTDATRVFYEGLENPLSVIGGSGDEKMQLTIEGAGASYSKSGPGQYIAKFSQLGTARVTANDGKTNVTVNIPVKRVPDPTPMIGGSAGGNMEASKFKAMRGLNVVLKDFVFEGVKFTVSSFTIVCSGKNFPEFATADNQGAAFSGRTQQLIDRLVPGSVVSIGQIEVIDPSGKKRNLEQLLTFYLD